MNEQTKRPANVHLQIVWVVLPTCTAWALDRRSKQPLVQAQRLKQLLVRTKTTACSEHLQRDPNNRPTILNLLLHLLLTLIRLHLLLHLLLTLIRLNLNLL